MVDFLNKVPDHGSALVGICLVICIQIAFRLWGSLGMRDGHVVNNRVAPLGETEAEGDGEDEKEWEDVDDDEAVVEEGENREEDDDDERVNEGQEQEQGQEYEEDEEDDEEEDDEWVTDDVVSASENIVEDEEANENMQPEADDGNQEQDPPQLNEEERMERLRAVVHRDRDALFQLYQNIASTGAAAGAAPPPPAEPIQEEDNPANEEDDKISLESEDSDFMPESPPPAPTIQLRYDDVRYTLRRRVTPCGDYELDFWARRHREKHGSHLLKIEDLDREDFARIEGTRQLHFRNLDVVKCDSYLYIAETRRLTARIGSKSDIIIVEKLKRLISIQNAMVNADRPDLSLQPTPADVFFMEVYEQPPGNPEAVPPPAVLITAGKADLSFAPARQRQGIIETGYLFGPSGWPPLVIESGLLIEESSLLKKVRWWFHASHGKVRVVFVVHLATFNGNPRRIRIDQWTCGDYGSRMRLANRATIWLRPEQRWRTWPGNFTAHSMYVDTDEKIRPMGDIGLVIPGEEVFGLTARNGQRSRDLVLSERDLKGLGAEMWNSATVWNDCASHEWRPRND